MIGIKLGMNLGSNVPTLLQQALSAIRRLGGTALYVPDDYGGAFVDSTGTQPVTAVNDLVGLLTDRSYGAGNLGGELVPATSYTGVAAGAWTISSNSLARNGEAVFSVKLNLSTAMATSKRYRVSFTVSGFSGDSTNISLGDGGAAIGLITGNGEYVLPAVSAGGTSSTIVFFPWAGTAGQAVISNISVREVLGNHATQGTTAAKPLVTQLANGTKALDFDGSNDLLTLSSGAILQQGSDHFVTAAFVLDAVGATQTIYATSSTTAVNPLIATFDITTLGKLVGYWRDNAGASNTCTSTTTLVAGVPYVATIAKVGINYTLWINGVVEATVAGAALGTTTVDTANIGTQNYGGSLNNRFNGKIIDIVIAQGTLTEADRRTIERNMAQRAGVTYVG